MRTYLPTLLKLITIICLYMERYELKIRSHLTAPQIVAFDALMTACSAFRVVMGVLPVNP